MCQVSYRREFNKERKVIMEKDFGKNILSNEKECEYTTAPADHLKTYDMKSHSAERPNKCNQCEFA